MLIDVYLLERFFYYFLVLLAGFVMIFDAFTLFDLLGDISKNHVPVSMVLNYFRYLVPLMVYQLAPLATLVATLVTLAVLAKNNEVIAFKASGISLYRLVLPLTLAGCVVAGGMFLLDDTFLALRQSAAGRAAQRDQGPSRADLFSARAAVDIRRERQRSITTNSSIPTSSFSAGSTFSSSIPGRFRSAGACLRRARRGKLPKIRGC